jgi:hypothetical protein
VIYKKQIHFSLKIGLLLIYILAITPKYVLHDLFANHQHNSEEYVKTDHKYKHSFNVQKSTCECEDLFTPLEFEATANFNATFTPKNYTQYCIPNIESISTAFAIIDNKGPPTI